MCSLAARYDNPIPTRFLAPIDCLKIPALVLNAKHLEGIVLEKAHAVFAFVALGPTMDKITM